MGILLAVFAALLSGISVIFSKNSVQDVNQYLVSAVSNSIVFVVFLGAVILNGNLAQIGSIVHWDLLAVSSITLVITWLFYYMGLKDGPVGGVLAIQNLSIVMTLILEYLLLGEPVTYQMFAGCALAIVGSILMMDFSEKRRGVSQKWIFYELISSAAIAVSFVFTKMDQSLIDTNLNSGIRYFVVAIAMWIIAYINGKQSELKRLSPKAGIEMILGGATLGIGYVFLYKAMFLESATLATAIFRLNIVVSVGLSAVFLREKQSKRMYKGLSLMTIGVLLTII